MTESQTNNNRKLPVQRILILSFQLLKQRFTTFMRMGLPLLLMVALFALTIFFNTNTNNASPLIIIIMLILYCIAIVMVIVGCHRSFLMNDSSIQQTKAFRWQNREWKFLGWGLLVGFFMVILYVLWGFIISALGLIHIGNYITTAILFQLLLLPITYLFSRMSLVFPATAVEDPDANIENALFLSNGNGWRLTFLIVIVPFIFDLLFTLISVHNSILLTILSAIVWLVVAVYQIGLLSLSYSFLKENHLQEEAEEDNNIESNNYEV